MPHAARLPLALIRRLAGGGNKQMTDETAEKSPEDTEQPAGDGQVAVTAGAPSEPGLEADFTDSSLYFNRELSWLDFNDRVLQLAEDPRLALLERLKFCAIYEDNLDEFFMVRVAGLHDQIEGKIDARGADGMAPSEVIDRVRDRVVEQRQRLGRCFAEEISPTLAERGIRVMSLSDATAEEREEIERIFQSRCSRPSPHW